MADLGSAPAAQGMTAPRARMVRVPIGSSVSPEPRRTGLRPLNLLTVGATQAAAEAAAAASAAGNMSPLSTRVDRAAPSLPVSDTEQVSAERTRYFRRLSALPPVPSHVPTMPAPALKFVDATRGVLFALSQIHNALSQHLSVSRDERLVAHLQRLLASAAKSMSALIASLDRLDAASQSSLPDGLVVRQVLETCHDSVRSFRRAVAAMHTKMSQLEQSVDPRFTRTLLLLLHGSLGELRHCAELMAPQAAHVASYLPEAKYAPVPPLASPSAPSEMSRTWTRGSYEVSEPGDVDALQTAASTPVSKRAGMAWSPAQVGGMPGVSPASSSRQGALSIATPVRGAKESDGHSAAWLGAPLSASSAKDALGARVQLVTARATEVFRELGDYVQARLQETADPVTHQSPSGSRAKRLRDVADACSGTMYVTEKLQATCEHASLAWTSGSQDHALLWSQANQFVRSIIHISTLVRAVSIASPFPRDLMQSLAEVNQGCSALAVQLHQLSTPGP